MPIIQTADISPEIKWTSGAQHQAYCGLDCCVTLEVLEAILPQLAARPLAAQIYDFEKALQAPYLDIMKRGFRVDELARRKAAEGLRARSASLQSTLDTLAATIWDKGLNPNSSKQLQDFLYNACKFPKSTIFQKGVRKISTNREALEKLEDHLYARPFTSSILTLRDWAKQLQVFEQEIDQDGRFRTSYNIAGTETGRPSSSEGAFGTGGNAQNIAPGLRHVFIADESFKLCVIDLEQVEARDVGFFEGCLFNDWKFLDNCESGDLHTLNAQLIWPELDWTNNPKANRIIADGIFYRDFTYRDMAKRGSHLSNYSGSSWTMARSLKIPQEIAENFQLRYCRGTSPAYPAHQRWWQWTATQLQTKRSLTTPFGRQRYFYGRPDDASTLREAIAFLPQSTTADRMNLALWRVWRHEPSVQLLAQTYDSITFQAPDDANFDSLISRILTQHIPVELRSPSNRSYIVPGEAKVGYNWGYGSPSNKEGLIKWVPGQDKRKRLSGLDRLG